MQIKDYIIPTLFFISLLLLWEFIPVLFDVPKYIFPQLSIILKDINTNFTLYSSNLSTTFIEAIQGLILGSLVGFITGVFMAQNKTIAKTILPYVVASNAIPIIAIAPLVVIWFGHGMTSKVFLAAFLCFFPISINTYKGLNEYNPIMKELFDSYGSSKFEFLTKFKLRNALPFILTGLKLSATYSVIGAIVAEFIGSSSGLGFGMLQASYNLNTPRLFGYIIISCLLGLIMYLSIAFIEYFINKKRIKNE
jgi:ABC-type nitrate/sulfonate/bicarbonate transport system permease component